MDFENSLQRSLGALLPFTASHGTLRQLTNDILGLLQQPYPVNHSLINSIITKYEGNNVTDANTRLQWQNIEQFVTKLLSIPSLQDRYTFLSSDSNNIISNEYKNSTNNNIFHSSTNLRYNPMSSPIINHGQRTGQYLNANGLENSDILSFSTNVSPRSPLHSPGQLNFLNDRRSIYSTQQNNLFNNTNKNATRNNYTVDSNSRFIDMPTLESLTMKYTQKILPETTILQSIPYTLLGTTSELFPFDSHTILLPNNILNGDSGLLHSIFEAGLLYNSLSNKVSQFNSADISPLKKCLLLNVTNKLQNYSIFINSISTNNNDLTLKSFFKELSNEIIVLRIYHKIIPNFNQYSGFQYFSKIFSLKSHGDLLVQDVANSIYTDLEKIYFDCLINWLTLGKLDSNNDDFFIELSSNKDSFLPFAIKKDRLLPTFTEKIWNQAYIIGKSLLLIKNYCNELEWANNFANKYSNLFKNVSHLGLSNQLSDIITLQYKEITIFTNKILFKKFYLREIILALKDILLMGRSDFILYLIDQCKETLMQNATALQGHSIFRNIKYSISLSSLKYWLSTPDNGYIVNGLDARLLNSNHGSLGWDVFTLDYSIPVPISLVLNPKNNATNKNRKEYLQIFNFLWRIKKNNYMNTVKWRESIPLIQNLRYLNNDDLSYNRDITRKISRMNILRNKIHSKCQIIETFCFTNIIEKYFSKLETKLQILNGEKRNKSLIPTKKFKNNNTILAGILKPNFNQSASNIMDQELFDIDMISDLHNNFLTNILSHKLLAFENKTNQKIKIPYSNSLSILLITAFKFMTTYSSFVETSNEINRQIALPNGDRNNVTITFNEELNSLVSQYKNFENLCNSFANDLLGDDEQLRHLGLLLHF
ncbi:hypothetical protein TBLA_0C05460 [Henningerozyma blattae CBS 6284]|uniref:Spindle pole body component n=1 Tax=Henningerozyma blattae (strain ATCC 34711 / CBS 6284 / DSM 70876 / NBRC 10599 / NRRL Y-10934 / UCD 77-7) TaxID=1071380 RepID=I2H1U2_HENB6|nr:hypothetical protein TBLA_0C05460 [Tetrapisispora blattae CBS 6284]CCH60344.1 hypothetical protein TBLA_0C05460 [Tetrapisispora blattae CBS 6284]